MTCSLHQSNTEKTSKACRIFAVGCVVLLTADEVLSNFLSKDKKDHTNLICIVRILLLFSKKRMNLFSQQRLLLLATVLVSSSTTAFVVMTPSSSAVSTTALSQVKGFGEKPAPKQKSEGQLKREAERKRYDELALTGQEYSVFVRQFGSDDKAWLPCGAIAVPRGSQVSDAIYANENDLKAAIVRTYPKLRGFESEFEFGFNLKVYPDDPVEVAVKGKPKESGISLGNWISTLLSPVDASSVKPSN